MLRLPPTSTLFPYTTLFRSGRIGHAATAVSRSEASKHASTARKREAAQGSSEVARVREHSRPERPADVGSRPNVFRRVEPLRRSEEHTSELQSQSNLVCRLL